jgi:hypothetical protein
MNQALIQLLKDCAAAPGALGGGIRLPDRTHQVCSYHSSCPSETLEKMILHLAHTLALLSSHDFKAQRLVWTFSGGRIMVAIRPDGAVFSLVTKNDTTTLDFFDQIARQFYST